MKTKLYFFIILATLLNLNLRGQSFEIPIYFEDSSGYKDSIVLGYDISASYGIDSSFGEMDLIDSAYSDDFEVRAAIYDYYSEPRHSRIIESKKMIIGYVCYDPTYSDEVNSIMVVMKSHHWPVNISWDRSLFEEPCNELDIIDCTPGGWFDVCGAGHPYSILEMRLTDTASYYDTEFKIETEQDTLRALFFRFNDFTSAVEDELKRNIAFFPNPTCGLIRLDTLLNMDDVISITDIMGRAIPFTCYDQHIDLTGAPDGMYILTLKFHTGESVVMKVIKKSN